MNDASICIILNAGSGKRETTAIPDSIRAAFADLGAAITLKLIEDGTRIEAETRRAVAEGFTTIVAAGGDGTICAVASALRDGDAVMGILPLGTFNYFARSLDIPTDIDQAARVIVEGRTVPLRIATVNDSVFLNNASLGTYPAVLEAREAIYKRWGRSRIAAYWAVAKTLLTGRSPLRLRIAVNGQVREVRTPLVFVVNNAYQLEQMALQGADQIAAGELVVFVAPDSNRMGMLRHALSVALRRAQPERNFEMLGGADILIETISRSSHRLRTVARDGERERMRAPFRFKVVEDSLRVRVPADRTGEVR